jgi:dTMP kinase
MGFFVTFEGIEGCGKSTQSRHVAAHLRALGHDVVLTREPGGTDITAQIRSLLADPSSRLDATAELMLFLADRAQHVASVVRPALDAGKIVLCDRYCDSTLAYQGYGRGHDLAWLEEMNRRASHDVMPDLTLWVDCPVEVGLARVRHRDSGPGDRFEAEPLEFHARIRRGFAELAARFPVRIVRVDSDRDQSDVSSDCVAVVEERLRSRAATTTEAQGFRTRTHSVDPAALSKARP